ncbi:hypothetical protein [Clostridium butyricum]|uniref:hypothetical protein n=1 Tax=Clostridium butyricum TaxID=1492 RepID=UPI00290F57B9|nr:hypothetical protein [Clostridium butyricum]MDU5104804.1 hypothetical protein [Clostridium butyricum]
MAKLTIEEIIAQKEKVREESGEQRCLIHIKKLGGELEAHSLSKGDLADVREKMHENAKEGTYKLIYMSIDYLRDSKLLNAYGCSKKNLKIVERLFPKENELFAVADIIKGLNGLNTLEPGEIYRKEIEDLKN